MFSISKVFELRREVSDPLNELQSSGASAYFESSLHDVVSVAVLHECHYGFFSVGPLGDEFFNQKGLLSESAIDQTLFEDIGSVFVRG